MPKPFGGKLNDEAVHLTQRALFAEQLNYPFDENQCPSNGHEYIHLVRKEREAFYPETATKDDEGWMITPSAVRDHRRRHRRSERSKLWEWKKQEASVFSQMALQLKSKREWLMAEFPAKQLPRVEDEDDCCVFCLGSDMARRIYDEVGEEKRTGGHLPCLSVVLHIGQEDILTLLKYLARWARVIGLNHSICRWVYVLLACLRKPVSSDGEKFLEEFYDECVLKIKEKDECQKKQLLMISTILANYFCIKAYKLGTPLERFQQNGF